VDGTATAAAKRADQLVSSRDPRLHWHA
jgi:hypothetical protein